MYYVVWCARSSISNATRLRPAYIAQWPFLYNFVQKLSDLKKNLYKGKLSFLTPIKIIALLEMVKIRVWVQVSRCLRVYLEKVPGMYLNWILTHLESKNVN